MYLSQTKQNKTKHKQKNNERAVCFSHVSQTEFSLDFDNWLEVSEQIFGLSVRVLGYG